MAHPNQGPAMAVTKSGRFPHKSGDGWMNPGVQRLAGKLVWKLGKDLFLLRINMFDVEVVWKIFV